MLAAEILRAVDEGLKVYWQDPSYEVVRGAGRSGYYIRSRATGHCIRLMQADGSTLNGCEDDFYISS